MKKGWEYDVMASMLLLKMLELQLRCCGLFSSSGNGELKISPLMGNWENSTKFRFPLFAGRRAAAF